MKIIKSCATTYFIDKYKAKVLHFLYAIFNYPADMVPGL